MLAFETCHEHTRQPRPELFLILNEGRVSRPEETEQFLWFEGHRIFNTKKKPKKPKLGSKIRLYAPVQLRDSYASRLLQQAGFHNSRIGVDFVDYGDQADTCE
jgi:hypothetical protein